jgi:hypothetical protein
LEDFFFFGVNLTNFSTFVKKKKKKKKQKFFYITKLGEKKKKKKKKTPYSQINFKERNITGAGLPMTSRIFSI